MAQDGAGQHPMKMGGGEKRANSRVFGGSADAMNMAWTARLASTSFRPAFKPQTQPSKGDPMTKSMNVKSLAVSLALVIAGMSAASAQSGPTPQEKMACRSDAEALCAEHIGKPAEMNACLRENKAQLSVPCRKVVEAHGG